MEILGVILSLAGLMYFAYRGVNVLILAPIMASFAALFQDQAPLMATYTQIFMPALGSYLLKYFPIFLLGAIFGKLMSVSGAAKSVGQMVAGLIGKERAILAVVLACAILTYGGVSLFVVAFCIYPIARDLFSEAKIQKRLIPGAIALGSFTFTMTALPGTPAIQNAIPMPYFNTNAFAAPVLGSLGAIIMFAAGMWWLNRRNKILGPDTEKMELEDNHQENLPHFMVGLAPLILVVLLNYILSSWVFPSFSFDYLNLPKFGETEPGKVIGLWSLISAMCISILFLIALAWKHLKTPIQDINKGTMDSLLPIFNTASEVGYGACIASFASFAVIKNAVLGIAPGTPLISEAIAINTLAGITGSASGGLSIALEALGKNYMEMAARTGLNPELLHRVASMACGGFDTLPHNGAVITLLAICSMDHKRSYAEIFMVAVLFPFLATAAVVLLGTAMGSF